MTKMKGFKFSTRWNLTESAVLIRLETNSLNMTYFVRNFLKLLLENIEGVNHLCIFLMDYGGGSYEETLSKHPHI